MMKRILIVIAIAVVAAGVLWVSTAVNKLQVQARNDKFNTDIQSLFDALQQYKEYTGGYPVGSNADIAKALKGRNAKNVFIVVGRKSEVNDKGEFLDPWGTPYRFYFSDSSIVVRCAGPNKRFEDSLAPNADDFWRSN